jgi:hypothetical protein
MKLPKVSGGVGCRLQEHQQNVESGIYPSWHCDSNCKWYQADCRAWKAINCGDGCRVACRTAQAAAVAACGTGTIAAAACIAAAVEVGNQCYNGC